MLHILLPSKGRRLCAVVLLCACGQGEREPRHLLGSRESAVETCFAASSSSRWNAAKISSVDVVLRDSSRSLGYGVAVIGAHLSALDLARGGIVALEREASPSSTIGQVGIGEGQILAVGGLSRISPRSRRVDWLAADSTSVSLLDGRTLHRFSTVDGRPSGRYAGFESVLDGHPPLFSSRVRQRGDEILVDVEYSFGYQNPTDDAERRELMVWRVTQTEVSLAFRMPLAALPRVREGLVHHGSNQAVALWDAFGDCIVAIDGGSGALLVSRIGGAQVDTVLVRTTLRDPPAAVADSGTLELAGQGGGAPPPPTLPRRVRRLVVDPDGLVWLEVVPEMVDSGSVQILQIDLRSGTERTFSAPVFPSVFPSPGVILGLRPLGGGVVALIRARVQSSDREGADE